MKSALDALIEELQAGTWTPPVATRIAPPAPGPRGEAQSITPAPAQQNWPPTSLDALRRFGQPHAKLFPFIGRKVRTPRGPGTLIQVFEDGATVVLDSELSRCSFFVPGEIKPVSWEF
jgi:hypothetical protein